MGQLLDEADGVGQKDLFAARQLKLAGRGIERGEEAVLDQHLRAGQGPEQGRLAGVGVADDRHGLVRRAVTSLALVDTAGRDAGELPFQLVDSTDELASVDLELGFTRASGTDATTLLAEVLLSPKPGKQVPQLCQFNLGLAFGRGCMLGEDVENDRGPIEGRSLEDSLEIELLGRRQLVVEDNGVSIESERRFEDLVDLALAHERRWVGSVPLLDDAVHGVGPGGVDQQLELIERRLGVLVGLVATSHAHENDALTEGPVEEAGFAVEGVAAEVTERTTVGFLIGAGGRTPLLIGGVVVRPLVQLGVARIGTEVQGFTHLRLRSRHRQRR